MSFGENKPARIAGLESELVELRRLVRFMAQAMEEHGYAGQAPACWQHIRRQMERLGVPI